MAVLVNHKYELCSNAVHVQITCENCLHCSVWHINDCRNVLNGSPTILMHKPPKCSTFLGVELMEAPLTSHSLWAMFCLSWNAHATQNTSHDSWPHFHTHVISFQKSPLQICQVSRRIWCLLSASVSRPCWNRKCEGTQGDKHSCCATPNVHTATPLGILSGDVTCSQAQRTHSCTAIGWRSMELVSKLFDTPTYITHSLRKTASA